MSMEQRLNGHDRAISYLFSKIYVVLALISTMPSTVSASEGESHRHSFRLSLGVGVSPVAHFSQLGSSREKSQIGFAYSAILRKSYGKREAIGLSLRGSYFAVAGYSELAAGQALLSIDMFHWWKQRAKGWFSFAGAGLFSFPTLDVRRDRSRFDLDFEQYARLGSTGYGATVGSGVTLSRHFEMQAGFLVGRTGYDNIRVTHTAILMTVSYII